MAHIVLSRSILIDAPPEAIRPFLDGPVAWRRWQGLRFLRVAGAAQHGNDVTSPDDDWRLYSRAVPEESWPAYHPARREEHLWDGPSLRVTYELLATEEGTRVTWTLDETVTWFQKKVLEGYLSTTEQPMDEALERLRTLVGARRD